MAANYEEDVSIVVIEDNNSNEAIGFPDLRLRLTPSPGEQSKNSELEIKQAHTALSTAYTSLKGKLCKLENENKGLKARLKKKGQDKMAVNNIRIGVGSTAEVIQQNNGLNVPVSKTNGSSILRRHSARLEGDQHRRHGSWAYFNDTASPNHEQYVKFLETQIENTEKEKSTLKMELEQLRLRFTDYEMSSSKLKQDISRLEKENQQLRADISTGMQNRRVADPNIEELQKMNVCLQNQLKNVAAAYDKACALNKQLEERLEHKIDTQERNLPRYTHADSEDNLSYDGQVKDMGLYKSMMNMTSVDGTLDSDDVNNLEYYIGQVKQQMSEVVMLKQLAAEQNQVIADLKQKLTDVGRQGKGSSMSSVTMNPVPCEHDLETRKPSPTNSQNSFKYNSIIKRDMTDLQDITNHGKIPSQNSDIEHQTDEGSYSERLFKQTLQDPVFISPPGVNVNANPMNMHELPSCGIQQQNLTNFGGSGVNLPPISVGGVETSDGGMFGSVEEGPTTMQYDESADFTIHHSGEGQTLVKNIQPSTVLQLQQQAAQNKLQQQIVSVVPPPSPHRTSSTSSAPRIRYPNVPLRYSPPNNGYSDVPSRYSPPNNGSSDEEVFDLNHTREKQGIRHGINLRDQYITSGNAILSPSENLGRVVKTPPSLSPRNSHEARCNHSQAVRERTNIHSSSPRHSDSTNPFINMEGISNSNSVTTSNHHSSNVVENRYRVGAQGTIPRPIEISRNLVTQDLHPPSYDNRSGHTNVNINTGSPREKIPSTSSTSGIPGPYFSNHQQVLGEKPVAAKNLESTYLTVKLPPVENTEELSDNTSDARTCPVCSFLFPVQFAEQQAAYERHVEDCARAFDPDIPVPQEDQDYRKCPMCEKTFSFLTTNQSAFEKHVQLHFETNDDMTERFEVLNF